MRKIIGLSLSIALGLTAFAAVPVSADPDGSNPNSAILYKSCPKDLNWVFTGGGYTFDYCFSDTVTKEGVANARFHGVLTDLATAPDKADKVTVENVCSVLWPDTSVQVDAVFVVTPSGKVNGTCKYRP